MWRVEQFQAGAGFAHSCLLAGGGISASPSARQMSSLQN